MHSHFVSDGLPVQVLVENIPAPPPAPPPPPINEVISKSAISFVIFKPVVVKEAVLELMLSLVSDETVAPAPPPPPEASAKLT